MAERPIVVTDRILTLPNALSIARLLGVPLFLWLVLGPEKDGWALLVLGVAGLTDYLDGIFDDRVFVISFVSNVLIAALIVYLGDQLGVGGQLSTGVIVVLGIRIFSNVAAIRRHVFHA